MGKIKFPRYQAFSVWQASVRDPLTDHVPYDHSEPKDYYPDSEKWYECFITLPSVPINNKENLLVVDSSYAELEFNQDFFIEGNYICFKSTPLFPVEIAWNEQGSTP